MNTKLLKQKILDLAIRGKLTQQLKTDGTTADLLKEISSTCHSGTKRSGAIESKKSKDLKPIIPLDKSEAPFEIPANWEWVRLGDVIELISGQDFPPNKYNAEKKGIPYITGASNFVNGHVLLNRWTEFPSIVAQRNDILLVCKGSGYGSYVYADFEKAHIARQIMAIRISDKVLRAYVYNYLGSQYELLKFQGNGLVPGIARNVVLDLKIPLPPLAEQQRIVAKIEEAFAEIDAVEKNKELLKTHIKQTRQKILDLAIHGKLVPQNKTDEPASVLLERITRDNPHYEKLGLDEVPFDIPENWCWCRLDDINHFQSNTENPMLEGNKNRTYELYSVPCFDAKYPEIVKGAEIGSTKVLVNKGDVLISKINPHLNRVWCVPQFTEHRMIASSEWIIIRNPEINQSYLVYVLQSGYFLDKMLSNTSGVGGSLTRAKPYEVKKYEIPLPPLAEQGRIVAKIEELFSTLDQVERNLV